MVIQNSKESELKEPKRETWGTTTDVQEVKLVPNRFLITGHERF